MTVTQVKAVEDLPQPLPVGVIIGVATVKITNRTGAPFDTRGTTVTLHSAKNRNARSDLYGTRAFAGVIPNGATRTSTPDPVFAVALNEFGQITVEVQPGPAGRYETAVFSGAVATG